MTTLDYDDKAGLDQQRLDDWTSKGWVYWTSKGWMHWTSKGWMYWTSKGWMY